MTRPDKLTPQQARVAIMVAAGDTDKAIAAALGLHCQSVRFHIRNIVRAMGLDRTKNIRVQIANRLLDEGVVSRIEVEAIGPFVYYARDGEQVKIGFSHNPSHRIKEIQRDRPGAALVAIEPGTMATERERHTQFAHLRLAGEWFRWTEDIELHIGDVLSKHKAA